MRLLLLCLFSAAASLFIFCGANTSGDKNPAMHASGSDTCGFSDFFDPLLADGFSFPFGDGDGGGSYISDNKKHDGWYIATATGEKYPLGIHTGEDWNGKGGGNTDLGQPVYATAKGKALNARDFGAPWGNVVYLEHIYIENAKVLKVYSLYAHLDQLKVKKGDVVEKRQQVGTVGTGHNSFPAHLHFEIRKANMKDLEPTYWPSSHDKDVKWVMEHYHVPSDFVNAHRKTLLPVKLDTVLIAWKSKYSMRIYTKGKLFKNYDISLSQNPNGHKQVEGDLKLPEGEYYITEKSKGPFYGDYKDYFGPAWMRISYPNRFDAEAGLARKAITKAKYEAIVKANKSFTQPPANSGLGGGIGIHGWAGNWPEGRRHLTWGCISMRNKDLEKFYGFVPLKTRILIIP